MTTLLVASTGGHLKQLHRLHSRLSGIEGPYSWATFDTPQSRSLLEGETVDFVPYIGSRDAAAVLRNVPVANRILRDRNVDAVVSTGSAVALPFFALGRARSLRCHYVESAARSDGPSTTGGLIRRIPGVHLYSQYASWATGRWEYRGSVFDSFAPAERPAQVAGRLQKVVVTLGTTAYGFERLVQRLHAILPADADVLWQTGATDTGNLPIDSHRAIPDHDLTQAMAESDVVVAHAGVGTALTALEVGRCPILVPRRLAHGEHVDDHQTQIARELADRALAISVEAGELTHETLLAAAGRRTVTLAQVPPFVTQTTRPETVASATSLRTMG